MIKKYRKYLNFTEQDLNKAIDLPSYEILNDRTVIDTLFYTVPRALKKAKFQFSDFIKIKNYKSKPTFYQHKEKESSYLVIIESRHLDTKILCFIYLEDGVDLEIHRDNKPAIIYITNHVSFGKIHKIISLYHVKHNTMHRDYGPQELIYDCIDGIIREINLNYVQNNTLYRVNHPATLTFTKDATNKCRLKNITFFNKESLFPKVDRIFYSGDGKIIVFKIFLSKDDSMTKTYHTSSEDDNNNGFIMQTYMHKGKMHRIDGPAIIKTNSNNIVSEETWVFDNIPIPQNVIKIKNKEFTHPPTKTSIIDAILFNREYGMYIKQFHEEKCNGSKKIS